jgi:hypothetical protein
MGDVTDKAEAAAQRLYTALDRRDELAAVSASALLDEAQSAAGRRPTPQARMVAIGFSVVNQAIRGPSGQLGEITMGAEFGSLSYAQFGARHSSGSWLFPTLVRPPAAVQQKQSAWLDKVTHG